MTSDTLAARGAPELRTQVRRWFVETGWTDGNGIGLWDHTDESVEVTSKRAAEALRDEWLSQGKIEVDRWNTWKRVGSYGAFRIRSVWEDTTPAALAASPEVAALIAAERARIVQAITFGFPPEDRFIRMTDVLAAIESAALRGEKEPT